MLAVVGDVTGHGLGACLFTTVAHAMIQQQFDSNNDLASSLRFLNSGLQHSSGSRFMTMCVVDVAEETGVVCYASAGHNPLLWINQGKAVWLDSTGMPLGIMPDAQAGEGESFQMLPGDWLVLYTDGFTETPGPDEEWYAEDRFSETVLGCWRDGKSQEETIQAMYESVKAWQGHDRFPDDLTVVMLSYSQASQ